MMRLFVFVLGGVMGLAGAWGSRHFIALPADVLPLAPVPKKAAPPPPPLIASADPGSWIANQVVNALRLSPDGEWVEVLPGSDLSAGDQLRTKAEGKLVISNETQGDVTLGPSGRITIRSGPGGITRLRCSEGFVAAVPKAGSISVELRGGDAIAASEAEYGALCEPERAYVHAAGGTLTLVRGDRIFKLPTGTVATIPIAGDVSTHQLPSDVEIQVDRPEVQDNVAVVSGRVSLGARIEVGFLAVPVDANGKFSVRYPLQPGENRLIVKATDVAGRERAVALPLVPPKKQPPRKGKR